MCLFGSTAKAEDPRLPVQYAAQRTPDNQNVKEAGNKTKNQHRAAASTMLTGSNGVGAVDMSGKKVLLGA